MGVNADEYKYIIDTCLDVLFTQAAVKPLAYAVTEFAYVTVSTRHSASKKRAGSEQSEDIVTYGTNAILPLQNAYPMIIINPNPNPIKPNVTRGYILLPHPNHIQPRLNSVLPSITTHHTLLTHTSLLNPPTQTPARSSS